MLTTLITYLALPLWVLAGLSDWWRHRRTSIESTTGVRESVFHLVLFTQMALGAWRRRCSRSTWPSWPSCGSSSCHEHAF